MTVDTMAARIAIVEKENEQLKALVTQQEQSVSSTPPSAVQTSWRVDCSRPRLTWNTQRPSSRL
jgi:hypothetical protein